MSNQQCCSPLDSHILIKAIYSRPPLWNKNHVSHKYAEVIEGLWNEVAVEVNSPKEVLKSRWKGLRDTFRKEFKKPGKSKWIHYNNLIFLEDMMLIEKNTNFGKSSSSSGEDPVSNSDNKSLERSSKDNVSVKEEVASNCDENTNDDAEDVNMSNFSATEMLTTEIEQPECDSEQILNVHSRKAGINSECTDSEGGDYNSKIVFSNTNNHFNQGVDDDYHFFMSLIPHVKSLPLDQKLMLRMKMQEIIYNEIVSSN